jgi:hypothetical protein
MRKAGRIILKILRYMGSLVFLALGGLGLAVIFAHEAAAVVPTSVTGAKDATDSNGDPDYQGMDNSKLVPILVAALKEIDARVTALE